MIEVREVKTKKDFKKFVKFPTQLYKGNKYYVPPMEIDELNLTNPKKNASFHDTDAVYFLAFENGRVVGRIADLFANCIMKKTMQKEQGFLVLTL